jgi:hypothetical protein
MVAITVVPKVLLSVPHRSQQSVYFNDPAHPEAPVTVPRGDLKLAWLERDYFYALITP